MLVVQDRKDHQTVPDPAVEALRSIEAILVATSAPVEEVERALTELGQALDPRIRVPSPQSAVVFERAVGLVGELPPLAHGPALAECVLSIARYAYVAAQPLKGLAPVQRAVELLRGLRLRPLLLRAVLMRGQLLADTGDLPGAIEAYSEALEIALELGDPADEAGVYIDLGCAFLYAGQFDNVIACAERVRVLSEGRGQLRLRTGRGIAMSNMAAACLHQEDYSRGLRAAGEAVELLDHPTTTNARLCRALAEVHYTRLLLEVDEPLAARQHCEMAQRFAVESGTERARVFAGIAEGLCEVYAGMTDTGISRLARVLEVARELKGCLPDVLAVMIKANEMAGRSDVALVYLRELMMHTRNTQQESTLLHHRLHLEQLERRRPPLSSPEALLAVRELKLRDQLVQKVAHQELMRSRVEVLERLAVSADLRTDPTGGHSYRVGKLASLLAQELGWDHETVFALELAARLHDIGEIGIPEQVLLKKGRWPEAEVELAQSHALIGADILAQSDVPHVKMAEDIARFHHERWDGAGYPFGLAYSAIPLAARITALADAFDELTHDRPDERALSLQDALHRIAFQRGKQFDPELTDLFMTLVPRLQRDHHHLDAYLGQAACESPFMKARQKIVSTLKGLNESPRANGKAV